jgi:hypothetical protein
MILRWKLLSLTFKEQDILQTRETREPSVLRVIVMNMHNKWPLDFKQ